MKLVKDAFQTADLFRILAMSLSHLLFLTLQRKTPKMCYRRMSFICLASGAGIDIGASFYSLFIRVLRNITSCSSSFLFTLVHLFGEPSCFLDQN